MKWYHLALIGAVGLILYRQKQAADLALLTAEAATNVGFADTSTPDNPGALGLL